MPSTSTRARTLCGRWRRSRSTYRPETVVWSRSIVRQCPRRRICSEATTPAVRGWTMPTTATRWPARTCMRFFFTPTAAMLASAGTGASEGYCETHCARHHGGARHGSRSHGTSWTAAWLPAGVGSGARCARTRFPPAGASCAPRLGMAERRRTVTRPAQDPCACNHTTFASIRRTRHNRTRCPTPTGSPDSTRRSLHSRRAAPTCTWAPCSCSTATRRPTTTSSRRSRSGCTSYPATARSSRSRRWRRPAPCGSTTRTSTPATTSATPRCRRPRPKGR